MGGSQSLPPSIERAKALLLEDLQGSGSKLGSGLDIPLDDIFVELTLLSKEQVKTLFKSTSFSSLSDKDWIGHLAATKDVENLPKVSFAELFEKVRDEKDPEQPGQSVQNILAYGGAGSGKTTAFLLVLLSLWLQGRVLVDKFDLMVAFELRDVLVQKADGLDDLLYAKLRNLGMVEDEAKEVSAHICRSVDLKRVCVVLDGLDECNMKSCSPFIQGLLSREAVRPAHVIVTSRPCPDAHELEETGNYQRHLEVAGFSKEKTREYVLKTLGPKVGGEMLEELEQNPELASMMCTPLFASFACKLYKEDGKSIPRSATGLYSAMICQIVGKKNKKKCPSLDKMKKKDLRVSECYSL